MEAIRVAARAGAVVTFAVLALAACGSSAQPGSGPTPSSTGAGMSPPNTQPTSPAPDDLTPTAGTSTAGGKAHRVSATGLVAVTVEDGRCVSMTIQGQAYVLVGAGVAGLRDGQRVTVTGHGDPTMATTCQRGPAFVVERLENLDTATN